ncbi:Zn-dependent peptidase ImmA, M78 family [Arcanobacterium phocae]|uniref:Zn-dependent peptidase ImmA, M78 family n=1 Tax=Arcanobacterium phocae TaxID=131112 RepID=A0A1H2LBS1_9ACTO|nr:ImmA/IrrE family metallo-endopeptidase [Arcanobacterium phocae]SDU78292.1 Zn-dependent peptidase ImmA, M78 family [Arcanobacterium phocae]
MSNENEGAEAAHTLREQLDIGNAPISNIFTIFDLLNIDVIFVQADNNEHGFTARDEKSKAIVVVVNCHLPYARLRSTLAHELAHISFSDDLTNLNTHLYSSDSEIRANAFSRHFLLPLAAVSNWWDKAATKDTHRFLNSLVRNFGVSPAIAAFQMSNADLIDDAVCEQYRQESSRSLAKNYGWEDLLQNRVNEIHTKKEPKLLKEKAITAFHNGKITQNELAAILKCTVTDVARNFPISSLRESKTDVADPIILDDDLSDLL